MAGWSMCATPSSRPLKNARLRRSPRPSPLDVPNRTPYGSGLREPCIRPFLSGRQGGPFPRVVEAGVPVSSRRPLKNARLRPAAVVVIGAVALLFLLTQGCTLVPFARDGRAAADQVARSGGFKRIVVQTRSFPLTAYVRCAKPGDSLNLYIEGDGAAWLSKTRLSDDPTPAAPLVLELAGIDPAANVAYLARPGQYADVPGDPAYWAERRFSGEVVAALGEAIDGLARGCRSGQIHLIGYSGGAALAVLVAAERTDVVSLRTVAGNLDPAALNRYHRVSPPDGASLDPLNAAGKLGGLPQRHFVGSRDSVVPAFIARSFLERAGSRDFSRITVVQGATHAGGWREQWRALLALPL